MSAVIVVSHDVSDFDAWKKGFDAHEGARHNAGITVKGLYRDISNPHSVTLIADVSNAEVARDMFNDPEFIATQQAAGVTSKPEVKFLQLA
ncbi:hypothetical protein BH09BAC1_BH09BAC1_20810 [soil metagenome]